MINKYCLPIIKDNKQEVRTMINDHLNHYQYFEVWLDYIDDLDDDFINDLKTLLSERLILLFRRKNLEQIKMNLQDRLQIIDELNNTKVLLDLDISQQPELDYIKAIKLSINTIISYHNYQQTPVNTELQKIIDKISGYQPTMIKIATMCNNEKDGLRLLGLLLLLKQKGLKYTILGMGEQGMITRIFGTIWGNEMIFAPVSSTEASAPGQLTKEQLETIFSTIHL